MNKLIRSAGLIPSEFTCSRCGGTFEDEWYDGPDALKWWNAYVNDNAWAARERDWPNHDPLKFGEVCDDCFGALVAAMRCRVCGCTDARPCSVHAEATDIWLIDDLCRPCRLQGLKPRELSLPDTS